MRITATNRDRERSYLCPVDVPIRTVDDQVPPRIDAAIDSTEPCCDLLPERG